MKSMKLAAFVWLLSLSWAQAGDLKLGVVLVVDQMRADYLERDPSFSGGLKTLASEGIVFTQARHLHIPTETCPGHAAISTGRTPSTHGIVSNEWFDRAASSSTYCVADSQYAIGPEHLDGPTLADAFKAGQTQGRVFSVSAKDRAAVTLGGHHPDVVLWLDRATGVFKAATYARRPRWLDAFNAELTRSGLLPLSNGKISAEVVASPALDEATARLVTELIKQEQVGQSEGRDLLFVSFSATDYVGHRYGTQAPQMVEQLRALDATLGRLLALFKKVSAGSLAVALTADHGAIPAPEDPAGKTMGVHKIDWETFGKIGEAALQAKWPEAGAHWILSAQIPHLYLNQALAAKRGLDWLKFRRDAAQALSGLSGVERVVVASDIAALESSDPQAALLRRSYRPDRAGDLILIVGENTLLHGQPTGTSHGTMWDYDTHVPLVFWGAGLKAAHHAQAASPLDIAPTLGRLLGVAYAAGDGGVLRSEVSAETH